MVRGYGSSSSAVHWIHIRDAPTTSGHRPTAHSTVKSNKDWARTHTIRNARKWGDQT